MAINSDGIPLFAGVEDLDDMFIATMDEYDKEVSEQIKIPYPLWSYLESRKLIEHASDIGTYVPVHLLDKLNSTVKDYAHYDDVDNTPQDALSQAKFAYGHTNGVQMYSREELVKNSGRQQLIDLVTTKQEQLEISLKNHVGTRFMDDNDSDGRRPMGLGRVMAFDQTCGTIDPTAPGFGYWNPQRGLKANGGQYALASEFREGMRRLNRLCSYKYGKPDVVVAGEDVYDEFQAWAESKLQIRIEDVKQKEGWDDFEMFPIYNQVVIYDDNLPAKTAWMLNFRKAVKVRIHKGTNFVFEPWQMMESKIAKKRNCLLYWALYVRFRNANGFIEYT